MTTLSNVYSIPYNVLSKPSILAEEPSSKLYNMVQQLWKEIYSGNVLTNYFDKAKQQGIDYLALVNTTLTLASSFVPIVGFIIPFINVLFPPRNPDIFELLRDRIEALIDQKITEQQMKVLEAEVRGKKDALQSLGENIAHNTVSFETLDRLHVSFVERAPQFIIKGLEAASLPQYIQYATMHILFLQDTIEHTIDWNLTENQKETFEDHIHTAIKTHTERAYTSFTIGLKEAQEKYTQESFMYATTQYALDIMALWPTFNPKYYTNDIDIESTRLLLTPKSGRIVRLSPSAGDPSTYTYANFPGILSSVQTRTYDRVDRFTQTLDEGNTTTTYSYGGYGGAENPLINIGRANPLIGVSPLGERQYVGAQFKFANGYIVNNMHGVIIGTEHLYGDEVIAPDGQKVHFIFPFTDELNGQDAWINAFIRNDITPENIIGITDPDTGGPITKGIPAEKGKLTDSKKIESLIEYINGANAIRLKAGQKLNIPIINTTEQNYTVRLRYASKTSGTVSFQLDNNASQSMNIKSTENNEDGITGLQGTYVLSSFINTANIPAKQCDVYITTSTDIILDRIEFVPIPSNSGQLPDLNIAEKNKDYEIWKSNFYYGSYLDGTLQTGYPYGGITSPVSIKYWDGNTLIHTEQQDIDTGKFQLKNITKWVGHFNRVTISRPNTNGTLYLKFLVVYYDTQPRLFFSTLEDIENITKQINSLFTSSSQTELSPSVTDYWIDQVMMKVAALSDEVFWAEKKALRHLVNKAKLLSKARNVLVDGDFESLDEWLLGGNVVSVADHDLCKNDHLLLQPPTIYPTYAYQKVDESRLRPNTRYTVSGFITQSEYLELVVSRYGKEVNTMLDIPYEEELSISSDTSSNLPNPHFFSYSIDVGSLYPEANPGIELGLRIVKPIGFAKISNLEIREDRPLTEKEIKEVRSQEQKWKKACDKERVEISEILQPIINRINTFYKDEDWNSDILPHIIDQDLLNVVLPELPKLRHWFMEDREGEHYGIHQQLKQALERVSNQLEEKNLHHNGSSVQKD